MNRPTDAELRRVLLGVRQVGFGPVEEVARRVELDTESVDAFLEWGAGEGYVSARYGQFPGWSLTPEGREHGAALLRDEVRRRGVGDEVAGAYDRFLELNGRFLALCTSWQLKTVAVGRFEPNHHDDPEYDVAVILRLGEVHEQVEPLLGRLTSALDRFGHYRPRLDRALASVRTGDLDYFTRPIIDSYHTVWFELHEDLLATLGRERNDEVPS